MSWLYATYCGCDWEGVIIEPSMSIMVFESARNYWIKAIGEEEKELKNQKQKAIFFFFTNK